MNIACLAIAAALATHAPTSQESSELAWPIRLRAGETLIDTGKDIGYAGPLVRDHDRDGLPDLLVSSFRGNIRFFRNVGSRSEPVLAEMDPLEAEGEPIRIHNW